MLTIKSFSILILSLLLTSCVNFLDQGGTGAIQQRKAEANIIDFAVVKELIFEPRCVSCHQQYETYRGVVNEISAIESAVRSDRMPKSGGSLTSEQKDILFAWIANGAPEEKDSGGGDNLPIELNPNWQSISENIIYPKCLACHNPNGQAKFLDLSSRQALFENRNRLFGSGQKLIDFDIPEKSYLLQVLLDEEEPMPPVWSNIPRLSPTEIETVKQWLSLGMP